MQSSAYSFCSTAVEAEWQRRWTVPGLAFPTPASPASIPQRAGVPHERGVNLLPPSEGKVSLGMDFFKRKPGGISRVLASAHHRRSTIASASWSSLPV